MKILKYFFTIFLFIIICIDNASAGEKEKTIKNIFGDFKIKEYNKSFEDEEHEVISFAIDDSNKEINKTKPKDDSIASRFFQKFLFTRKNQIFQDNYVLFSIYAGYDLTASLSSKNLDTKEYEGITLYTYGYSIGTNRKAIDIAFGISLPTKLWGINGRFTFSLYTFFMKQNIAPMFEGNIIEGLIKTKSLLGELSQEIIFGHQYLYITFGFGISYAFLINSWTETNSPGFDNMFKELNPQIFWNNSEFNWLVKASLGHRFDCGLVLEFMLKHYSSGGMGDVNNGTTMYAVAMRYVF